MTDELKKRMGRLRAIAPRLNSATDQASKLVAMVEKFLVSELHIGIPASVAFDCCDEGEGDEGETLQAVRCLAFGRVGGVFRVHVAIKHNVILDDEAETSITTGTDSVLWPSCDRETKLKAFEKLPELLDTITSEAERLAQTAEATRVKVQEMIGEEEPVEEVRGRARVSESGGAWGRQLADAAHRYRQCERDVVESEVDSDAWESRMEAEGRDDADPRGDWDAAREKLIRLVCIATGHDPAEQLDAPIAALTDDWLLVVSPGRDDPSDDDEDVDSRRLSVISRTKGLTFFS
jgi:hypothetical protein